MPNQNPQNQKPSPQQAFNILYTLTSAHSLCIWPFIRHTFGVNAFGLPAAVGLVIIILFISSTQSLGLLILFWLWLALVGYHRIRALRRERTNELIVHSQYAGYPFLAMKLPFIRTEERAKQVEPLLCMLLAACFAPVDQGLAAFLLVGSFSMGITTGVKFEANRVRVRRMRDAMLENEFMANQFRNGG